MPKMTVTGEELGSSETAPIVLGVDDYGNTRDDVLEEHKLAKAGVEVIEKKKFNKQALLRGTHLEHGVAAWFLASIQVDIPALHMWEPKEAFRDKELRLGSSIDRILEIPLGHELVIDEGSEPTVVSGKGIIEIKTDFYHQDRCKPMWMIQVHQQMMTSGLPWAIVVCMNQKGQLKLYPFHRDDLLVQTITDKVKEFWHLVETDGEYPPLPKQEEVHELKEVFLTKEDRKNFDLDQLCSEYQAASSAARSKGKDRDKIKDQIQMHMDGIGADIISTDTFTVKSVTTKKEKKQMVPVPGVFVETTSFNIKEVSHDD